MRHQTSAIKWISALWSKWDKWRDDPVVCRNYSSRSSLLRGNKICPQLCGVSVKTQTRQSLTTISDFGRCRARCSTTNRSFAAIKELLTRMLFFRNLNDLSKMMSKTNCLLPEVIVNAPYSLIHLATCQTAKCIVLEIVRNVDLKASKSDIIAKGTTGPRIERPH